MRISKALLLDRILVAAICLTAFGSILLDGPARAQGNEATAKVEVVAAEVAQAETVSVEGGGNCPPGHKRIDFPGGLGCLRCAAGQELVWVSKRGRDELKINNVSCLRCPESFSLEAAKEIKGRFSDGENWLQRRFTCLKCPPGYSLQKQETVFERADGTLDRQFSFFCQKGDSADRPGKGSPGRSGNLISNGGFEQNNPGNSWTTFAKGSTGIPHWRVTKGSVDVCGPFWKASAGKNSLDLSGGQAGALAQTVETEPGRRYVLTFDLAGNPDSRAGVKTLVVRAGDVEKVFKFDTTGKSRKNMGWVGHSLSFTARSGKTEVDITSRVNIAFGPFLDNVEVRGD